MLNVHRTPKSDYLFLLPILGLAFYIAFIPHLNYPYPVHIDEWAHLVQQNGIIKSGSTTFIDPFYGQLTMGFTSTFETGYDLFWSIFHQISGIPWMIIYRYFPSAILMLTVLSAYVLGRRQGFGWEAAFFTSLIPTTVGIMGPAFLIPVAMGLLFIPLSIYVAFNFRNGWSYVVLFILTSALLTIHAATALGLVIILAAYVILNLRSNFKHSLGITLALGIPILVPFLWISHALLPIAKELLSPQPLVTYVDLPRIIQTYGYLPIIFCLLGTFLLAIRGEKKDYGLIFGLVALLVMLASFFTFQRGIPIMYYC